MYSVVSFRTHTVVFFYNYLNRKVCTWQSHQNSWRRRWPHSKYHCFLCCTGPLWCLLWWMDWRSRVELRSHLHTHILPARSLGYLYTKSSERPAFVHLLSENLWDATRCCGRKTNVDNKMPPDSFSCLEVGLILSSGVWRLSRCWFTLHSLTTLTWTTNCWVPTHVIVRKPYEIHVSQAIWQQ